jgi:four helix bundle protein
MLLKGGQEVQKKIGRIFLSFALKSANETKYWLCLIRDTMEVSKRKVGELIIEADEISKIIASIIINSK